MFKGWDLNLTLNYASGSLVFKATFCSTEGVGCLLLVALQNVHVAGCLKPLQKVLLVGYCR